MEAKRFSKKFLKIAGFILAGMILLFIAFHLWFIYHSKDLLENMVEERSKGKLKLKIERLSYNYFTRRMVIKKASFFSVDTSTINTSYHFDVPEIRVRLKGVISFIIEKRLIIEYMNLNAPDIIVTRLHAIEPDPDSKVDSSGVSVPYEMGQVYRSIQNVLRELKVEKFWIHMGKFTLINKIDPNQKPVSITDINLNIENLKVSESPLTGREDLFFSDNIMLHCNNQDISFPDGRHRLKFESFKIDIRDQIVEFNNCTISGEKTDSAKAAFSIFFDKLKMSNVDFDTLYRNSVIKADTVFCLNPRFMLKTEISQRGDSVNPGPRLENIIQQLTGDLLLATVIVKNASFDIETVKNDIPNSFTSDKNDFEMQGLSINQKAEKPVTVKGFVMAIRNYENFIKDSSYRVQFDSVVFREDKIYLSNFLFNKLDNGRVINTFSIPQFYLGGLSWDELVFNNKLSADQATLFNPQITYYVSNKTKKKPQKDIFGVIAAIDDYMDLEYLDVQHGNIKLVYDTNFNIQLNDATLAIQSRSLLHSTDIAGIKKSLNDLKFKNGVINAGGFTIQLLNTYYVGQNGSFSADELFINSTKKKFSLHASGAEIEKMIVDEKTGDILAEGITWKNGDLTIIIDSNKNSDLKSILELKRITGNNTKLNIKSGSTTLSANLEKISINKLEKKPGNNLIIEKLLTAGKDIRFSNETTYLTAEKYTLIDSENSNFSHFIYSGQNSSRDLRIESPQVLLIPRVSSLLKGKIELDRLEMNQPGISIIRKTNAPGNKKNNEISIKQIILKNPFISYAASESHDHFSFTWGTKSASSDFITAQNFSNTNPAGTISISDLRFLTGNYNISGLKNIKLITDGSQIEGKIRDIDLKNSENGQANLDGHLENLFCKKIRIDSVGKKHGTLMLEQFNLSNFNLSSLQNKKFTETITANPDLKISDVSGSYADSVKILKWENALLDKEQKLFHAESFSYKPAKDRQQFIAGNQYQSDYITFGTGKIKLNKFDIDLYLKKDSLRISSVQIENATFSSFRDKRLPFKSGIIKLLPSALPKKFPPALLIDSIIFSNSNATYAELDGKTHETATIPMTQMNAGFYNVKNINLSASDSFRAVANFRLLDTIKTKLNFRQSYTDSLHGFLLYARMEGTDLKILNPILAPLASVLIRSGKLDSLNMSVSGNEYTASGEMKMIYKDLKIAILNNDDKSKKNRFRNFIANTFIIKNKNTSKKSAIFFERMRDRSVFQYIVRFFANGISTSTGLKSNKKTLRRIKKQQKN
ncbi:MAG TPA: hypothetical protein PKC72_11785 [Chitinophagaceae bacterium]|nr:hypothetical protein [Chitinophagaceae bacterium]